MSLMAYHGNQHRVRWFNRALLARAGLPFLCLASLCAAASEVANQKDADLDKTFSGSLSCRECHTRFYQLWSTSFHGLAMQPYTSELGKTRLTPQTEDLVAGKYRFRADVVQGTVIETSPEGKKEYPIVQVAGGKNVYYFLTSLDHGWLQVLPVAYDVRHKTWFDTTASAMRHFGDRRDEALYWKERPLTFNTSCYNCHVSQLSKNYDLKTDSYHTTWAEPGINCETCHGPSAGHVALFKNLGTNQPVPADIKLIVTKKLTTAQRNDMCAPCHAKMSPLTDSFMPGDRYFDHFDLTTLDHADFYPDGRDLGENYTFTSWRMSPCAKSGQLDCIHCHTSSGRYRFAESALANNACLPCHNDKVSNAPAHTHHKPDSEGNKCISCHMPMTEFARMRRSDHSMRPPTPAATLAFKSPNACNLCHTNEPAWADKVVREWHKNDYQKPVLELAGLIDAARKNDWKKLPETLAYLSNPKRDEITAASLVRLLGLCPDERKWPVLRKLLDDSSPLVRACAADALGQRLDPANTTALLGAVSDSFRLVRVRAAAGLAALSPEAVPADKVSALKAATQEYIRSLQARPDDMASHYNLGNFYFARGAMKESVDEFQLATRLDPGAMPPYVNASLAFNALGQNDQAETSLRKALALEPTNAVVNLNLGMLLAEMERSDEAEKAFRLAFKYDPHSAQAAYNLGILVSKKDPAEAIEWCARAAKLRPEEPRYAYTLAFFQVQKGMLAEAAVALRPAVEKGLPHPESYAMLGRILEQQGKLKEATEIYSKAAANPQIPQEAREAFETRVQNLRARSTGP